MSNPLMREALTPPALPPAVQALFDRLVMVECVSRLLARYLREAEATWASRGPPNSDDWPARAEQRHMFEKEQQAAEARAAAKRGEPARHLTVAWSPWVKVLERLEQAYRGWCARVHEAEKAVDGVAALMDAGEPRPAEKWTTKTRSELSRLAGLFHPIRVGDNGQGLIHEPPLVPAAFESLLTGVGLRRIELQSAGRAAVPASSSGTQPVLRVDAASIERLRAAELRVGNALAETVATVYAGGKDAEARRLTHARSDASWTEYRSALTAMHNGPTGWINGLFDAATLAEDLVVEVSIEFPSILNTLLADLKLTKSDRKTPPKSARARLTGVPNRETVDRVLRTVAEHVSRAAASVDPRAGSIVGTYAEPMRDSLTTLFRDELAKPEPDVERVELMCKDAVDRAEKLLDVLGHVRPQCATGSSPLVDQADGEFKPASFFGKKLAERLRQATLPGRKSKRVRSRQDDGVKLYCVEDVQKWWGKLLPKA